MLLGSNSQGHFRKEVVQVRVLHPCPRIALRKISSRASSAPTFFVFRYCQKNRDGPFRGDTLIAAW